MDGTDARACEHRVHNIRSHGHVDAHRVSLLDPLCLQNVGKTAHLVVKLRVCDVVAVFLVVGLVNEGDVIPALGEVSIDAVFRSVELRDRGVNRNGVTAS